MNKTFKVCRLKDAYAKEDQSEDQKRTKVTVSFNKLADFRPYEQEEMGDGATTEEVRMAFLTGKRKFGAEKMMGQAPKPELVRVVERQLRANMER